MFCSNCGSEYKENDKFCSKCGKSLTENTGIKDEEKEVNQEETDNQAYSSSQINNNGNRSNKNPIGCMGYLFIFVIILCIFMAKNNPNGVVIDSSSNRGDSKEDTSELSDLKIKVLCRQAIRSSLKAPSTAKFPFIEDDVYKELDQKYTKRYAFESYIDAENSFGAKIRTNYKCVVNYNVKTGDYGLYSLKFYE